LVRSLVTALLSVTACGFQHGMLSRTRDGAASDSVVDISQITDAGICLGSGAWTVCLSSTPASPLVLTGVGTLDTTNDTRCLATQPPGWETANQPASCFLVGQSITLDDRLDVQGTRPLVLVATQSIAITGTLDVASHRGGKVGPGAGQAVCQAFWMVPTNANSGLGGGGGAGATFLTKGGDGGKGNNNKGNRGQAPLALSAPTRLRAGCGGQDGGDGDKPNLNHGPGAAGGGAVYLLAGATIAIQGAINASGAGAAAGGMFGGGGGGGSGGMIVISTGALTAGGRLLANGGGGAGGGDDAQPGSDGGDPDEANPYLRHRPAVAAPALPIRAAGAIRRPVRRPTAATPTTPWPVAVAVAVAQDSSRVITYRAAPWFRRRRRSPSPEPRSRVRT
jgi:hypothetical protein